MQAEALLDHSKFIRDLAASLTFAHEDPDDVVQETWLAAVRNPPQDGPGVRGWLATVVRNALRQSRRSGGRLGLCPERDRPAQHQRHLPRIPSRERRAERAPSLRPRGDLTRIGPGIGAQKRRSVHSECQY